MKKVKDVIKELEQYDSELFMVQCDNKTGICGFVTEISPNACDCDGDIIFTQDDDFDPTCVVLWAN